MQCLGKHFAKNLIVRIIVSLIFINLIIFSVGAAYAKVPANIPTGVTVTDGPGGRAVITWNNVPNTAADGTAITVVYELLRGEAPGSMTRIAENIPNTSPYTFTDNRAANDAGTNGSDTVKDGTFKDTGAERWGKTYYYAILAHDAAEAAGANSTPEVSLAAKRLHWCDNTAAQIASITGPAHNSIQKKDTFTITANITKVDWDCNSQSQFTLNYSINGGAATAVTMNRAAADITYDAETILTATMDLSATNNNDTIKYWITGADPNNNALTSAVSPTMINSTTARQFTIDAQNPTITGVRYLDFGTAGISRDDQIVITFSEDIQTGALGQPALAVSGFRLENSTATVTGNFGAGATIIAGPLSTDITISLGDNPSVKFNAADPTNVDRIKYINTGGMVRDTATNNANTTTAYRIGSGANELPVTPKPKLTGTIQFTDSDNSGTINTGDKLRFTFDKKITLKNGNITQADFQMPVTGDTLSGTGNFVAGSNTTIDFTLAAAGNSFMIAGTYSNATTSANSPSGIDILPGAPTNIVDDFNNPPEQVAAASGGPGLDIVGVTTVGPKLVTAEYIDAPDANGIRDGLSAGGDFLRLTFDKPIIIGPTAFTVSNAFTLYIGSDNLDNPTFSISPSNPKQLLLTFNSAPSLTVPGTYPTGNASGIDISSSLPALSIMDINGNKAIPSTAKDIIYGDDAVGPSVIAAAVGTPALYTDNAPSGVSAGDYIDITFNKPLYINGTLAASDFQTANLNFGSGATFAPLNSSSVSNKLIRVTLGTGASITFNGANRSTIDVNTTSKIQSWGNVNSVATPPSRNITASPGTGPKLTKAVYTDVDNNWVSVNDTIVLTFDKPISCDATAITAIKANPTNTFSLLGTGSPTLGGAGLDINQTGLSNNQLRIILGANPSLTVAGVYNSSPNATGIDIAAAVAANHTIEDLPGNGAVPSSPGFDIEGSDTTRPTITKIEYTDTGIPLDGITAGDTLTFTFSKAITADPALNNNAFTLPVSGDNLGTSPFTIVSPQPAANQITIRFASNPSFKVAGVYNGNIAAGSSSGININTTIPSGMIADVYGNTATASSNPIDIGSTDSSNVVPVGTAPTNTAIYTDIDNNGVSAGDLLELDFNKPILVNSTATTTDFILTNGSFGSGATVIAASNLPNNNRARIRLGTSPSLQFNPPSATASTININGTTGNITDVSGNSAVPASSAIQVSVAAGGTGPYVISAAYTDAGNDGVTVGDTLLLTFNKSIVVNNPQSGNFQLPLAGDTLGTNPTFTAVGSNQIKITLGANPKFTVIGTYTGPTGTASGINIQNPAASPAVATAIIDLANNPAIAAADAIDIGGPTPASAGPKVVSSKWADVDNSGTVSAGDTLSVTFDKAIFVPPAAGSPLTNASFNLPVAGDNMDFSAYAKTGTYELTLTLTNNARFRVDGIYTGNNTAGQPSGIDISASIATGAIMDVYGITAVSSAPAKDIGAADTAGPTLITAVYRDANNNNTVDQSDVVTVTFSKPVKINNPVVTNFNLLNGSFGSNPVINSIPANNKQISITLGTSSNLTFVGSTTSSVDIAGTITTITDASGNPATQSTQKFISVDNSSGQGPKIVSAVWTDVAPSGVGPGDTIKLTYDKDIIMISPPIANDFVLPVNGDSIGVGISAVMGSTKRELILTLGTGANLKIVGVFNPSNITAGSPSGIDTSTTGAISGRIIDNFGNNAMQNTPVGIDITSSDTTGPKLVTAIYEDVDTNGVTVGDRLILTFDKQITAPVMANVSGSDFSVLGTGNLGINPQFEWYGTAPTQFIIRLGSAPSLTVPGVYPADSTASGLDVSKTLTTITDLSGNGAFPNTPAGVDIGPFETVGPHVVGSRYQDTDGSKTVTANDNLYVVFSKPIRIVSPVATDFRLGVSGDTLGGGVAFSAGNTDREVKIRLGTGVILTPGGVYGGSTSPGSPSGIDVLMPSIASVTDVYGNSSISSNYVDIDDGVGPSIISAIYNDVNNNGVDTGDTLLLRFTKPITINNVNSSDLALPVTGDTLGTTPQFAAGSVNTDLAITLGTGVNLTIAGVYSPYSTSVNSPSGINISTTLSPGHITDLAGNNATLSTAAVDLIGVSTTGPTLQSARWVDVNGSGVSGGDKLILTFDKPLIYRSYQQADYNLPVSGDSLGYLSASAVSVDNADKKNLVIVLGTTVKLTVPGVFNSSNLTAGSPSGIDVTTNLSTTKGVMDVYGNPAAPSAPKDITGSDTTGPVLISAVYYDPNSNGVDKNDVLSLSFDKSVQVNGTISPGEFVLPVAGDSFGVGAQFAAGTTANDIRVTLGLTPVLTIAGVYTSSVIIQGSPSGIGATGAAGAITDFSGNRPQATTAVDIVSASVSGPQLLLARVDDVNGDFIVSAGDRLVLTFNKPVKAMAGLSAADIVLPVTNDSLGSSPTFQENPLDSKEIFATLQAGVKLTPDGFYSSTVTSEGSPSGVGIRAGSIMIQDYIGNNVVGGSVVDVADTFQPFVTSIRYEDVTNDGLTENDRLYVTFSEKIVTSNVNINDFALTETLDSFGDLATVTQSDVSTLIIKLGKNPRFKVAGVYPTDAGSSGLDISNNFTASHIKDTAGNSARKTTPKDIFSNDTVRPTITKAIYGDANNNGIVDAGDTLSIRFSKAIVINNPVRTDFTLINGTFGTGGTAAATQTATAEITFLLGNAPLLIVDGVYPTDPAASAIDLSTAYVNGHITDIAGNNPAASGFIDIEALQGPVITSAAYYDVDANGVSQGDQLRVKFSRNITVNNPTPSIFVLPVLGDSLGTNPTITQSGSTEVTITLGSTPIITVAGTFLSGNTAQGSPSGININDVTTSIKDASGNGARALPSAIDITGSDPTPPQLVSVVYEDIDGNGISVNDKLTLTFSENVILSNRISLADFNVVNGSFGDGPKFNTGKTSRELVITLGTNPIFTLFGSLRSAIGRNASTYISGHIMDVSGNDWQADVPAIVTSTDRVAPTINYVKFVDADNLGISAGDRLEITFNKPVVLNSPLATDFILPVSGDSFGLDASVISMTDPKTIAIVIGNGAFFTVRGVFAPGNTYNGAPSGLNLARELDSVVSIAGVKAKPHAVAVDITSDDITSPKIVNAESLSATNGKNIIKAKGDSITLSALIDDPSLKPTDITADLSKFGLGNAVPAQSYINGTASWAPFATSNMRGTTEVVIKAIDVAGNVGTYGLLISVIMPVEKCIAEILPASVLRKSGVRDFSILFKPYFRTFDTGMDKIVIKVPQSANSADTNNFRNIDISQSKVTVNGRLASTRFNGIPNGGEATVTYNLTNSEITVLLGERVTQNTSIPTVEVTFKATVPDFEDSPFGKLFTAKVDDTKDPADVATTDGDVNGITGDSDSLKVTTVGVQIKYVTDNVVITPSFWKVIFSIKFNADMNAEKPPRVTFRPTYTLQNEQQLTMMSFVDGLYTGYAVVPFEAFGFNGDYMLKIYDAQDYMGNSINTLSLTQRFSPKFLISAYVNPLDERSLIINTKYIQSATGEVLTANPTIRVWQDGTNETMLSNVTLMARPGVYKGVYNIDPKYAGRAQIEVEAHTSNNGNTINGKSVVDFTSAFISTTAGAAMVSSDKNLNIAIPQGAFDRNVMMIMTPDFSKISQLITSGEKAPKFNSLALESDAELKVINEVYQIYPDGLKAKTALEVTCSAAGTDTKELSHTGLFALNSETGKWELISRENKDGKFSGKINKISSIALFKDLTAPKISVPKELADNIITDKFEIDLSDAGSGIDQEKTKALIDGRLMKTEYNETTNKLTLYIPAKTAGGLHNISVEVSDKLGNKMSMPNLQAQSAGYFDVLNYISYPNPARNVLNIRYTLGKNISDMNIKVYDTTGAVVYDFGDMAPGMLTAGIHTTMTWNLTNDDGVKLANGVYIYKITAYDTTGEKLEKYGKIAILK